MSSSAAVIARSPHHQHRRDEDVGNVFVLLTGEDTIRENEARRENEVVGSVFALLTEGEI
ncbi:hypothetical protein L484_015195 [Morus notabilis]|uniref:Uncharacterized protein n=1 Tax=Morus notabilis TaxID=981085 RepID=W9SS45_9ROSA|nr:hypothetical protein L484_015195 [Morus notabilis]